jgi:hypothetical protein
MFVGKAVANSRVEHLTGTSLGYALALPTNIRLDWGGLSGTNTLFYYEHLQITDVKKFLTLGPVVIYLLLFSNKLDLLVLTFHLILVTFPFGLFLKYFTRVIYSQRKISYTNLYILQCAHYFQNAPTYFARVVSYTQKMFMKSDPDVTSKFVA